MHRMRHTAAALLAICASLLALTCAVASALPEALPGAKGTKFTGKSGKGILQIKGGVSATCSSTTGAGELASPTSGTGTVDLKGCTIAGLPVNSLGDASGTLLISGEVSVCYINKSTKDVGIVVHSSTETHAEVPSTKLLLLGRGSFILLASPVNTKTTKFTGLLEQKEGKQAITKCEGGEERILEISTDAGPYVQSGLEAKENELTFSSEQELMA